MEKKSEKIFNLFFENTGNLSANILVLFYYQRHINISKIKSLKRNTIYPFEDHFMKNSYLNILESDMEQISVQIKKLIDIELIKQKNKNSYSITGEGVNWAYNLVEYTIQIELENLNFLSAYFSDFLKKGSVLDVGCGNSSLLNFLANYFKKMGIKNQFFGVDYNLSSLRIARLITEKISNSEVISFFQADANILPFRENSFDIINSKGMIIFVDRKKYFQSCLKLLKKHGIIITISISQTYIKKNFFHSLKKMKFIDALKHLFGIINGLLLRVFNITIPIKGKYYYGDNIISHSKMLEDTGFKIILCEEIDFKFSIHPIVSIAQKEF